MTEMKLFNEINSNFVRMYESFYKFEKDKAIKINTERKKLDEEINKLFEKKSNAKILHHYLNIIHATGNCLSFILGIKL